MYVYMYIYIYFIKCLNDMMCLKKSMQCASRSCVTDYRDAVATSIRIVLLYIGFAIIAKL